MFTKANQIIDDLIYPQILEVPFDAKDEAKAKGAMWDNNNRRWYIDEDDDIDPFYGWWPRRHYVPCYSDGYYIATSKKRCNRCHEETSVNAVILPENGMDWDRHHIKIHRIPSYITEVLWLDKSVIETMKSFTQHYKPDFSKTLSMQYWMNHCEHCNAKIGDFFLYEDVGSFLILRPEDAAKIKLHKINSPLQALISGSVAIDEFNWIPQN